MIYCNLSDRGRKIGGEISGHGYDLRDELAAILIELKNTELGQELVSDAIKQSEDPEWQELYDSEIRTFPDPDRRRRA